MFFTYHRISWNVFHNEKSGLDKQYWSKVQNLNLRLSSLLCFCPHLEQQILHLILKKDSREKHELDNIKTLSEGSNLSQFFGEKNIRKQSLLFLLGQLGSWKLELKAASYVLYFTSVLWENFVQKWNFAHELCPKSTELPVLLPRDIIHYF